MSTNMGHSTSKQKFIYKRLQKNSLVKVPKMSKKCSFFENDRVAFKVNKINLGRINKKKVGWALKEIYTTITNEGLTYEYLEFIKENVLLFKDVELNKDDLFYCNLYKYFTTKV